MLCSIMYYSFILTYRFLCSYLTKIDLFSFASSPDSNLSLIEFSLDSKRSLIGQQSLYYVSSPPDSKRSLFASSPSDSKLSMMLMIDDCCSSLISSNTPSVMQYANSNCLPDMWVLSIVSDSNVANLSFYVQR